MTWRSKPIESEDEDEDDLNVEHMNRRMQQPAVAQPDERADSCEVCFIQTQDPRLVLVLCGHQSFCLSFIMR